MTLFNVTFDLGNLSLRPRRKCVLVVEDHAETIELIRWAAGREKIEIVVTRTAEEAIGVMESNGRRFVAAIIDIGLPGADGWSLRQRLKSVWPSLGVCMMSGSTDTFHEMPKGELVGVLLKSENYGAVFREINRVTG